MIVSIHKCRNISHPFPIVAWVIMLLHGMKPWSDNAYSHMAISILDNNAVRFFDSSFSGVKQSSEVEFLEKYDLVETHSFKVETTEVEFMDWFSKHNGKDYDFKQLLGLLLKLAGLIKFNRIGHNLDKLICNELILDYIIDKFGYEVIDSDNFDLNTTWKLALGY